MTKARLQNSRPTALMFSALPLRGHLAHTSQGPWPHVLSWLSAVSGHFTYSVAFKNNSPHSTLVLSGSQGLYLEMWGGQRGLPCTGNRPDSWSEGQTDQLFAGRIK